MITMKINRWVCAPLLTGAVMLSHSSYAGPQYEQNIDKSFAVTPGGKLIISADMGPIHIVAGSSDKLEIHVLRKVEGGEKAAADDLFSRHEVTFTQEGNTVSVTARNHNHDVWHWNSGRHNLEVSYEVTAPRQFNMDLTTAGGDISLEDLDGKLGAHTTSGAIRAGNITGGLDAKNAGGDIVVKAVGQDAAAATTSGTIEIKKTGGKVDASNAGGDIRISEAGSSITAHTTSGSITIGSASGAVEATDAGGDIHITDAAGKITARTTSGAITVGSAGGEVAATDAGGDIRIGVAGGNVSAETTSGLIAIGTAKGDKVRAENQGGNVEIGHARGAVNAHTTSGSVSIEVAEGPVEAQDAGGDIRIDNAGKGAEIRTTSGSIRIRSAKGRIRARDAGGNIEIFDASDAIDAETTSGKIDVSFLAAPKADSRLDVAGGDINVAAPSSAGFELDAQSQGGNVESELPVAFHGRTRDGRLQGEINGGGPRLFMHCTSGDIRMRRSTGSPTAKEADARR
jgi:DUF4097 and DUF4098 domain-containing protein YvlB